MLEYRLAELNGEIEQDMHQLIERCERAYAEQIVQAADLLSATSDDCPFILLSGPSGSGKTTTALRIEQLLEDWRYEMHTISLDHYYLPDSTPDMPVDDAGNPDYESPYRLDIELLHEQLARMLNMQPVEVPRFSFSTQSRKQGKSVHRKRGEFVLIEGIHTLNPEVIAPISQAATRLFVNIEWTLVDGEQRLPPERQRLMRRLVRDRLFRACAYEETIGRFESVLHGETKYIYPYRSQAAMQIDSFLPYELGVYKGYLAESAHELPSDIKAFIERVLPVDWALSPDNSIVREVTGNSVLVY